MASLIENTDGIERAELKATPMPTTADERELLGDAARYRDALQEVQRELDGATLYDKHHDHWHRLSRARSIVRAALNAR